MIARLMQRWRATVCERAGHLWGLGDATAVAICHRCGVAETYHVWLGEEVRA